MVHHVMSSCVIQYMYTMLIYVYVLLLTIFVYLLILLVCSSSDVDMHCDN